MALTNDGMDGISGFIHVVRGCSRSKFQPGTNVRKASEVFLSPEAGLVIPNTIKTTLIALEVAKKFNSVTRFVLTSSSAAAIVPVPNEKKIITTDFKHGSPLTLYITHI